MQWVYKLRKVLMKYMIFIEIGITKIYPMGGKNSKAINHYQRRNRKEIKRFYYRLNEREDYAIHASFPHDKHLIDKYIQSFSSYFSKSSSTPED